tara:strand:+ start:1188 stop:1532 length:345 start_codon:yes stop_codon:yes gene_type:complete
MKAIFKITHYLKDENRIIVRVCYRGARKSIDDYPEVVIDLNKFETFDAELFSDSMYRNLTYKLERQEEKEPILESNIGEKIEGDLNIEDLVGKVINCGENYKKYRPLRMRKIEL